MADDLDDFFNDIEEIQVEEGTEEDGHGGVADASDSQAARPSKRLKREMPKSTTAGLSTSFACRPRGMVVAAASSSIARQSEQEVSEKKTSTQQISQPLQPETTNLPAPVSVANEGISDPVSTSNGTRKPMKRMAAGKVWVDPTLDDWPENDYRIFCGNLDRSLTDQQLHNHFSKYASIAKAKVVQDSNGMSKGYGFVSFLQPLDCAKSIREMDQSWLGSRPIRVKRSDWQDRNLTQVLKKKKKQSKQRKRMGLS